MGILERIEEKLDRLLAGNSAVGVQQFQPPPQQQFQQAAQPQFQQAAQPQYGTPQGQGGYPPATQEMIVALVTPMVADANVKAALQQEMGQMGIAALPDAQPHQYAELYHRFQQVQGRFSGAQQQQMQPAAQPASII